VAGANTLTVVLKQAAATSFDLLFDARLTWTTVPAASVSISASPAAVASSTTTATRSPASTTTTLTATSPAASSLPQPSVSTGVAFDWGSLFKYVDTGTEPTPSAWKQGTCSRLP
jgi:hypothetical protein